MTNDLNLPRPVHSNTAPRWNLSHQDKINIDGDDYSPATYDGIGHVLRRVGLEVGNVVALLCAVVGRGLDILAFEPVDQDHCRCVVPYRLPAEVHTIETVRKA